MSGRRRAAREAGHHLIPDDRRRAPRVLFYTHDSYGLGHLRRTLGPSRALAAHWPGAPQLVVRGSPVAGALLRAGDAPQVALPPVIKVGPGRYEPREPARSLEAVMAARAALLRQATGEFRPGVVVDPTPAGCSASCAASSSRSRARGGGRGWS